MSVGLVKLFGINGNAGVQPGERTTQGYSTNPLSTSLQCTLNSLDITYGQSPVITGSGVGDGYDSYKWLKNFGC